MLGLIKAAMYGLFLFMLYEFASGLLANRGKVLEAAKSAATAAQDTVRHRDTNLTGASGDGISVAVRGAGGARRKTKVGRGVI